MWLIGAMVCLLAAFRIQLFAGASNACMHNCKALLETRLARVSSAVSSTGLYLYFSPEYRMSLSSAAASAAAV